MSECESRQRIASVLKSSGLVISYNLLRKGSTHRRIHSIMPRLLQTTFLTYLATGGEALPRNGCIQLRSQLHICMQRLLVQIPTNQPKLLLGGHTHIQYIKHQQDCQHYQKTVNSVNYWISSSALKTHYQHRLSFQLVPRTRNLHWRSRLSHPIHPAQKPFQIIVPCCDITPCRDRNRRHFPNPLPLFFSHDTQ